MWDLKLCLHLYACFLAGLLRNSRRPIEIRPQAMLEARDLPRCEISDFLQERLDKALAAERVQRAKEQGLPPKQVSTLQASAPESLTTVQWSGKCCVTAHLAGHSNQLSLTASVPAALVPHESWRLHRGKSDFVDAFAGLHMQRKSEQESSML